jgi:hypothetical protein
MRTTDIIRGFLDLLDQSFAEPEEETCGCQDSEEEFQDPEESRFKQIYAHLSGASDPEAYVNCPDETVSGVDSVTTGAGGGLNGPKHPDDIRVKDPRQNG